MPRSQSAVAAPGPPSSRQLAQLGSRRLADLLAGDVLLAAAGLLGSQLVRTLPDGRELRVTLVETEAYHMAEPGCHAHKGQTSRTAVMFGPPGRAYVYFTYGMWHCVNVVCEAEGTAAAVLLRAAFPAGPAAVRSLADDRRAGGPARLSGPGLLCQAMEITRELNGVGLLDPASPLRLERPADWHLPPIDWTRRVGFSFECQLPWRAVWRGHPAVSPGRPGVVLKRKRDC